MTIRMTTPLPGGLGPSDSTGVHGPGPTTGLARPLDGSAFMSSPPAATTAKSLAQVTLPMIAKSVDGLSSAQRLESAGVLTASKALLQGVQAGRPAEEVAKDGTALLERLQGKTLISSDAHEIVSSLTVARNTLLSSPAYTQGMVIPHEQSVAEGKIHQSIGMVTTALRMPSS